MRINEIIATEAADPALCRSSRSGASLGASNLASCKSQGLRSRTGSKSHLVGNTRITVQGKKLKGARHGGDLPDYS